MCVKAEEKKTTEESDIPADSVKPPSEELGKKDNVQKNLTKGEGFQILFELFYLICILIFILYMFLTLPIENDVGIRNLMKWAFIGGLTGGWLIDAKWLYTVTARGRNNQKKQSWESKKIIWRIMYPLCAGTLSLSIYMIARSGIIFFLYVNDTFFSAFSLSFLVGCFYDNIISKINIWTSEMFNLEKMDKFSDNKSTKGGG